METDDIIDAVAGCLSTAAFLPQAWQIWKSRSARDVSWAMYAVLIAGVGLWIVYGLRRGALPLVLWHGPGSNSRFTIGIVIIMGCLFSTLLTVFIVPAMYNLLAGFAFIIAGFVMTTQWR